MKLISSELHPWLAATLIISIFVFLFGCSDNSDSSDSTNPCEGVSCSGYGTCIVANDQATCRCNSGYHVSGLECFTDLCRPEDCIHGHCMDPENVAMCTCDQGYDGVQCDQCAAGYTRDDDGINCVLIETDGPCNPSPCINGECSVESNQAVCTCYDGYDGLTCDTCADGYEEQGGECVAVSPCNPDPCVHGICSELNGLASCDCEEGYEGVVCDRCARGYVPQGLACVPESANDPCTPNPCQDDHRSVCTDVNGDASCSCDPGWHDESGSCVEDTQCDAESTCSGHGQCGDAGLACICDQGYTGEHCDTCDDGYVWKGDECVVQTTDPCDPNPCLDSHRTSCRNQNGLAVCNCDAGYHLDENQCVEDVSCDAATTCSGNGTCTGNGLECECLEGYTAANCSQCADGYVPNGSLCVIAPTCPENHSSVGGVCVADCDVNDEACAFAHASFGHLVTTNGFSAVVVDLDQRKATRMWEHIYKMWGEGVYTRDLLYDTYLGVRIDGDGTWLNTVQLDYAGYYEQEGIIHLVQHVGDIRIETMIYAPFQLDRPALVLIGKATNLGRIPHEVSLYSINNYRLGNTPQDDPTAPSVANEDIYWDTTHGAYVEEGPIGALVHRPLGTIDHYGVGGPYDESNPWRRLQNNQDLSDDSSSQGDDRTCGFQKSFTLASGESGWLGSVSAFELFEGPTGMMSELDTIYSTTAPDQVLSNAVDEWEAWRKPAPDGMSAAESTVYRVSEAILRMGQVREANNEDSSGDNFHKPYGQILAALPPGNWNITWVRDMTYAISALIHSGHYDEAQAALRFILEADSGHYLSEVGSNYQVSVCRYYGRGKEETDSNDYGPNIEFDGFGLFLWVLKEYIDATQDLDFIQHYWPGIRSNIANTLVALVQDNGMIAPDCSIWEVHWNGQQKQFTYTSLAAARGLADATFLSVWGGEGELGPGFDEVKNTIIQGIETNALDNNFLVQSVEEFANNSGYVDASVVEAFNWNVFSPDGQIAQTTFERFDSDLRVSHGWGYFRNDDGGEYDSKEWVFIDLRAAQALRLGNNIEEADALLDWITAQAINNMGIIAELQDPVSANYDGAVPMVGFGAGAYMINLWLRHDQLND